MLLLFFSPLVRSREQFRKLPISHQTLTSLHGTVALQNCESSASRLAVPSRLQEPSPESNDLAMSRLRIRESAISPCVGLAPSLNVCTRKKRNCCTACCIQQYCCNSSRVLGTHWVHTLGHLESTNLPTSVAARIVSNFS